MVEGEVLAEGKIRRRCTLVGRSQKSENEREAMSIMKYILLKWRRGEDFVDRVRGRRGDGDNKKGCQQSRGLWNVENFENFLFASFLVAETNSRSGTRCLSVSPAAEIYRTTLRRICIARRESYDVARGRGLREQRAINWWLKSWSVVVFR